MKLRAIRATELTPEARIDAAKRSLASAIDELIEARLAKGAAASEWVDQSTSPLGKSRHLRLVRAGVLPAAKDGNRRLVRREDIEAYLQANPVHPSKLPAIEDDVDAMMKRISGGKR